MALVKDVCIENAVSSPSIHLQQKANPADGKDISRKKVVSTDSINLNSVFQKPGLRGHSSSQITLTST